MQEYFADEWDEIWKNMKFTVRFRPVHWKAYCYQHHNSKLTDELNRILHGCHYTTVKLCILNRTLSIVATGAISHPYRIENTFSAEQVLNMSICDILKYIFNHNPYSTQRIDFYVTPKQNMVLNGDSFAHGYNMELMCFFQHEMEYVEKHIVTMLIIAIYEQQYENVDYTNGICICERIFTDSYVMEKVCGFL